MYAGWQLSKHISLDPVKKLRKPSTILSIGQAGKGRSSPVSFSDRVRNRYAKKTLTGSLKQEGG